MESLEATVKNIKDVKIQGAKEIAVYALKFLRGFCKKNGFGLKFEVAANFLEEARPTAVVLHNCIEILKKDRSLRTIDKLVKYLEDVNEKLAKVGMNIIKDGSRIMTHCHSGEASYVIAHAWKSGRKISVLATETEPLQQGIRTVKELAAAKVPVTLIVDSAMGHFMNDIDIVVIGADALRTVKPKGLINKIGTLLIALAAKEYHKPLYIVSDMLKIDNRKTFKIEERPHREIYKNIKGVKMRNPAFDIVPFELVTGGIITDRGVLKPKDLPKFVHK